MAARGRVLRAPPQELIEDKENDYDRPRLDRRRRYIARTKRFYDAALEPLGYTCLSESDGSLGYGKEAVALWISRTSRPVPSDHDSGLHFCFTAPTRNSVDTFHAAALCAGGEDNGMPGLREDYGPDYYAAYAIDPDGYRIEAYCGKAEG